MHGHRYGEQRSVWSVSAREGLASGLDSVSAALEAGFTRLRPVLMTALAMIIGMVPMVALEALGEGGEQTAPLGRAVIGAGSRSQRSRHCFLCRPFLVYCTVVIAGRLNGRNNQSRWMLKLFERLIRGAVAIGFWRS